MCMEAVHISGHPTTCVKGLEDGLDSEWQYSISFKTTEATSMYFFGLC